MQWQGEKLLVVSFGAENLATADLQKASMDGRRFATGFASTSR
jgi:hypothetical protein